MTSIACGPSLKQAQRSVERYEQCYGADFNPEVTLQQRERCWSDWLAQRVADDPPERIRYAEMRLAQLATNPVTKELPDPATEPPPTYQHEYPRKVPPGYPSSGCTPLCADRWAECNSHCEMKDKDCTMACEAAHRICIGGCP